MNKALTPLCLVLVLIFSMASLDANESLDSDRKALVKLVNHWIEAEVNSDREALSAILHEDFVSTFANGTTINKEEYLDFIIALDIKPFTVINESTHIHGDTAVVIDVDDSGKTKFTWIAHKHNDTWLVIAQTFSQIKQTK